MTKLKPCPFCGSKVYMIYNSRDNTFKVYHTYTGDVENCFMREPMMIEQCTSLAEAAEAWNRRADNG